MKHSTRSLAAFILLVFATLAWQRPHTAEAQGVETVAVGAAVAAIGTLTVNAIFDRINQAIDEATKNAESTGNRLMFSAVDQSRQMIKQLGDVLAKERETVFRQLSDQRKLALWDLYSVAEQLRRGTADDFAKGVVQINKLLSHVNFIGKDVRFLIVRVMPTVFLQNAVSNNPIQVYGVGFGTDDGLRRHATQVSIAGRNLPADRIALKEWGIEIFLQQGDFSALWRADEFARAPMVIESTITGGRPWWCFWQWCETKDRHSATYHIDLYPTRPANLTMQQRGEQESPAGAPVIAHVGVDTANLHDQGKEVTYSTQPVSAGADWQWVGHVPGSDTCNNLSGNGCPFTNSPRCQFSADRQVATCSVNATGHAVHWRFAISKQRYEMVQTELPNAPVSLHPGESVQVMMQANAKLVWLEGTLPTGRRFGPVSLVPPAGGALDQVSCVGGDVVGDKRAFVCTMREPM